MSAPSLRVLLSEGSSLSARETVTCLGPAGVQIELLDPDPLCLARFSRWVHRVHRCPPSGTDPVGYLSAVRSVTTARRVDALLATHEQAWLFAAARSRLSGVPVAVADITAFDRVQSKLAFARLLDELGLPQPRWHPVTEPGDLAGLAFPYWLKTAFSTAGQGVRLVTDERSREVATGQLLARASGPLIAQLPAVGRYGQVQALFDHGRLVAAHTSVQTGTGIGPSAAARLSVDHPLARRHVTILGEALAWHGGLTLDYLHRNGVPQYIECNPRTVEPANAAAGGVNLPLLALRLTTGEQLPSPAVTGRPGVRTHGTIALLLGTAAYRGTRRAVAAELARAVTRRGCYRASAEQLTPVHRDPPSAVALGVVIARALASPDAAASMAARAVDRYAITADTIDALTATVD